MTPAALATARVAAHAAAALTVAESAVTAARQAAHTADQTARHALVAFLQAADVPTPAGGFYSLDTADLIRLARATGNFATSHNAARAASARPPY